MKICVPVDDNQGIKSRVCAHFGSAPLFMIVETESGERRAIPNANQHHGHGMCTPLAALSGESIDGLAVGGIGMGAINKLLAAGIAVFLSEQSTVEETLAAYKDGTLRAATAETACGRHHGSGIR